MKITKAVRIIKELEEALNDMVKKGYLDKTPKGYVDSKRVKLLLKQGKTRKQIAMILERGL